MRGFSESGRQRPWIPGPRMSPGLRDTEWEAGAPGRRDLEPRTCGSGPRGTPLDSRRWIPQGASLGLGGVDPPGAGPPCRVRGRLRIPIRRDREAGMGKRVSLPPLQGQQFQRLKLEAFLLSASSQGPSRLGRPHPQLP